MLPKNYTKKEKNNPRHIGIKNPALKSFLERLKNIVVIYAKHIIIIKNVQKIWQIFSNLVKTIYRLH